MNKYIVPICNISKSRVYNKVIIAKSTSDCQEKIMEMFSDYSASDNYKNFIKDLDEQDILIGQIYDVEEL